MINNIPNNTFKGTVDGITQEYMGLDLTSGQMYFAIGGFFLTVILFLFIMYFLFKTFINKSCVGCKRLAKCEKDIKDIQEKIELNGYFDKDWVLSLSEKIDKLQEDITNG